MRFIFSVVFLFLVNNLNAEEAAPSGCKPIVVSGESILLSAKNSGLVIIHNISNVDLWITHPVSEPSASAGESSRLQERHWSALAQDKNAFELSCIESKPGHEQQVPCAGVVSVCHWSTVKMPTQSSGTYWAGENMALNALITYLGDRGFELPAATQ